MMILLSTGTSLDEGGSSLLDGDEAFLLPLQPTSVIKRNGTKPNKTFCSYYLSNQGTTNEFPLFNKIVTFI